MAAPERHEQGRITDEGIAKLRERIGKGFDARQSWRTEINRDTIWHIAHAMGDLTELYTDPDYASRSKWGRLRKWRRLCRSSRLHRRCLQTSI